MVVDEAEGQIRIETECRWADTATVGPGSLKGIQQGPLFDGHGFERGQHGIVIIPEKEGDMIFDVRMTLRQAVEIREMSLREGLYARRRIKAEKLDGAAAGPDVPERCEVGDVSCVSKVDAACPSSEPAARASQVGPGQTHGRSLAHQVGRNFLAVADVHFRGAQPFQEGVPEINLQV